jgi:2-C-methyl-D-erythritol 4-phosphate cytidylyltransferase
MGTAVPKQFLDLAGKPVLAHTISAFLEAIPGIQIVLVLPEHQISYAQMILQSFPERVELAIVGGGDTRFQSVKNGLAGIPSGAVVLVHDGVRPMVSAALIASCCRQAIEKGSAIPVIPVPDSIRRLRDDGSEPEDRSVFRLVQTPQAFKASILLPSFQRPYQQSFTDEAAVVEAAGHQVHLIEGERSNIKITTPEDLLIAEALIRAKETV